VSVVLSPDFTKVGDKLAVSAGLGEKTLEKDRLALAKDEIACGTTLTIAKLITSKTATMSTIATTRQNIVVAPVFSVFLSIMLDYIIYSQAVNYQFDFLIKSIYNLKMFKKNHYQFIIWFSVVFLVTFTGLYLIGFVPSEFADSNSTSINDAVKESLVANTDAPIVESTSSAPAKEFHGEEPTHIKISKIGVDASVSNPKSTNAVTLDDELTHGAVHYPGSGLLADGNVFIFGHSTNWTVVHNQAYKTFNGLKDLQAGDEIDVTGSAGDVFIYKVDSVTLADDSQVWVDLSGTSPTLTISTCNTFGEKQQRYVVKAEFVKKQSA
jgi:LPXTG-site transpeptidase (sortase) family protein